MKIRKATIDDIPQMAELWMELMNYHADHHLVFRAKDNAKELVQEDLKKRIEQPGCIFFLLFIEELLAGFISCSFRVTQQVMIYNKRGYVAETVVSQQFRGQGVGQSLFERAQQWFEDEGADHIELQVSLKNNGAMNFWERQGFEGSTRHMVKYLKKKR